MNQCCQRNAMRLPGHFIPPGQYCCLRIFGCDLYADWHLFVADRYHTVSGDGRRFHHQRGVVNHNSQIFQRAWLFVGRKPAASLLLNGGESAHVERLSEVEHHQIGVPNQRRNTLLFIPGPHKAGAHARNSLDIFVLYYESRVVFGEVFMCLYLNTGNRRPVCPSSRATNAALFCRVAAGASASFLGTFLYVICQSLISSAMGPPMEIRRRIGAANEWRISS